MDKCAIMPIRISSIYCLSTYDRRRWTNAPAGTRLEAKTNGDKVFSKPAKLYLNNPNLNHCYCQDSEIGTIREEFFFNMLSNKHKLLYPKKGDFIADEKFVFEIGWKNKSFEQIKDVPNSFVVADDIEVGFGAKIPLWLFGFLY